MLFQENNLFFHLDLFTNVALGISPALRLGDGPCGARRGVRPGGAGGHGKATAARIVRRRTAQGAAIARALVRPAPDPLLDEPFAALGPALRRDMLAPRPRPAGRNAA